MAKRDKRKSAKFEIEEQDSGPLDSKPLMVLSSSDDEEANEDLSLKIIEKALLVKAARLNEGNDSVSDDQEVVSVVDLSSSSSHDGVDVARTSGGGEDTDLDLKSKKIVKREKKKTKIEKFTITEDVDKAEMIEKVDTVEEALMSKAAEAVESLDPNTVDISDNIVLRKLLRGPRYFDPPDSGWETCYNCGEEGHMAVNCKSASKRKKSCFLCGSLDHGARQCSKEIQCYICKSFGHLCCVNFVDTSAREVSCYRCGQLGHTGLSCGRSLGEAKETTDNGSPSLCYKCGEGGHFARECPTGTASSGLCYKCGEGGHFARECSSLKVGKRNHESSTPNVRPHRENKEFSGYKSAPHDHGKSPKRKIIQFEEKGFTTPQKEKQRGGWIKEDPRDFSNRKSTRNHWNSPSTPSIEGHKKLYLTSGGSRIVGSQSSKPKNSRRFSASRFSNFGNDEPRRIYNWW
ncbi:protein AIR2-like isoform X2 [Durio zibethinus]|uniref:Protein AIR2-like isoform X2 n=1 Tax=Durio zibethinus TaxID=66656 RepID=A0A6P5YPG6_DURZI|nr:protein AIR2-like isoform X2 [Durio zibethinus]